MTSHADLEVQVRELTAALRTLEAELRELRGGSRPFTATRGSGPRFAAIYSDFTEEFRGSSADVSAKLEGYLPDARALARTNGVVDLGSGRGEWLSLLRSNGIRARGVDSNPTFVALGQANGLDVEHGDAIGYLRRLPPDSIDMVTSFHLIEHLPVEEILALLEAAYVAVRPGGCVLLETPNPSNLVMGACDFYNDPTHLAPLPPALTQYLVRSQGFRDIEVRLLHPKADVLTETSDADDSVPLRDAVCNALFGPQDYAVLGFKSPSRV